VEGRGKGEVTIPYDLRPIIGRVIVQWLLEQGYRVLAIAVGKVHTHLLVELKDDIRVIRAVVGEAKRNSSRAVKKRLPGSIWSAGLSPEPVDNPRHQLKAFEYILYEQGPGAWTWSFHDKSFDGMFDRQRPEEKKDPGRRCALPRRGRGDTNRR
jgi:hypothetical protein